MLYFFRGPKYFSDAVMAKTPAEKSEKELVTLVAESRCGICLEFRTSEAKNESNSRNLKEA
jgi:hypothetical protein